MSIVSGVLKLNKRNMTQIFKGVTETFDRTENICTNLHAVEAYFPLNYRMLKAQVQQSFPSSKKVSAKDCGLGTLRHCLFELPLKILEFYYCIGLS